MNQDWFEMHDVRTRYLNRLVWVPLRSVQIVDAIGHYGYAGYREEFYGVGSLALSAQMRDVGSKLGWNEIGTNHSHSSYCDSDEYVPADTYRLSGGKAPGLNLVLEQHLNGEDGYEWHLHQDMVFALRLKREYDSWVCPESDYTEVARLRRNSENRPVLLEMRAEFLRDYLCARTMVLRAAIYRSRVEVVAKADHINWKDGRHIKDSDDEHWEGIVAEINEGGAFFGDEIAVIHAGRTDVDPKEDVPAFKFPTDDQIESKTWTTKVQGKKLYRIQAELWRSEWLEPSDNSFIVRGDDRPATVYFITDQSGNRETQDTLVKGSRWLWFKPDVVVGLLQHRGGFLSWYTRETGQVRCSPENGVHFGINDLGLVNIYAKDIGMLPEWQQRIWAGFNVSPEGGVSEELLASQMRADPAKTKAPEAFLAKGLKMLNQACSVRLEGDLLRFHEQTFELLRRCHRFRATDEAGLYSLAKDLTRIFADDIDVQLLRKKVNQPKGENWGSLKLLEKTLAATVSDSEAHEMVSPLVGIYELRLADAHPRSSDVASSYKIVGIDTSLPFVHQALQMLHAFVSSVYKIASTLKTKQ